MEGEESPAAPSLSDQFHQMRETHDAVEDVQAQALVRELQLIKAMVADDSIDAAMPRICAMTSTSSSWYSTSAFSYLPRWEPSRYNGADDVAQGGNVGIGEQGSAKDRTTDSAAAGKERRRPCCAISTSPISVSASHRYGSTASPIAATGPSARSRWACPLYLALSATMAVVMMLVLRGCVPSLRRLAWPLAVVQGLASVALVVPLLPASPSASIFYAVAAALAARASRGSICNGRRSSPAWEPKMSSPVCSSPWR